MESERYCFTIGWVRSDYVYDNADEAYQSAKAWCEANAHDVGNIRIWRRLIEEVYI